MTRARNVQDAHISSGIGDLHAALIAIVSVMNRPQNDVALVKEAGVALDGVLFPLLVGIQRLGPIGVVELADRLGRDYTTVSRQIAKLELLGLVTRQAGATDRRVREAAITREGKAMTDAFDAARERTARRVFGDWSRKDFEELVRLMTKFAAALDGHVARRQ